MVLAGQRRRCHNDAVAGPQVPSDDQQMSSWQRFLAGRTTFQRLVLALGALAAAVLAIGAVVAGVGRLLPDRALSGGGSETVTEVQNQAPSADAFVRLLLNAAQSGSPVQLNHKVIAEAGDGHYRLQYNCGSTGCSFARLETPADIPATFSDAVLYEGCWAVVRDGAGFGADHLDLELRRQGAACP